MREIDEINMLVHPDYDARDSGGDILPYQQKLRDDWEAETWKFRKKKTTALIYVSALKEEELEEGLQRPGRVEHPVDSEDVERIRRWQEILGERIIVFPDILLTEDIVKAKFQDQRIVIRNERVQLRVYGEFEDQCVSAWKNDLIKALNISPDQASILSRLSLSSRNSFALKMRQSSVYE